MLAHSYLWHMRLLYSFLLLSILLSSCKKDPNNTLSLTGRITDPVSGNGIQNATVTLRSQDLSGGTFTSTFVTAARATTDASGNYTLQWDKRTSAEYRLEGNKSGHISYQESINPDVFNNGIEQTRNFGMPSLAWITVRIKNVNPFDNADEVIFQLTGGYQDCGSTCCSGMPVSYNGINVDSLSTCQVYGGSSITWQAIVTKNSITNTLSNGAVAVPFDTTVIEVNY